MVLVCCQMHLRKQVLPVLAASVVFMAHTTAIAGSNGNGSNTPTPWHIYTPPSTYNPPSRQDTPSPSPTEDALQLSDEIPQSTSASIERMKKNKEGGDSKSTPSSIRSSSEISDLSSSYHIRRVVGSLEYVLKELQNQQTEKLTHQQKLHLYWILLGGSGENLGQVLGKAYPPAIPISVKVQKSDKGLMVLMNIGPNKRHEFRLPKLTSESLGELRNYFPLDRKEQVGDVVKIPVAINMYKSDGHGICKVAPNAALQVIELRGKTMLVKYLSPHSSNDHCAFGAELILPRDEGTKMNFTYLQNVLKGRATNIWFK